MTVLCSDHQPKTATASAWIIGFLMFWCLSGPVIAQQLPFAVLTISDGLEDMVVFDAEQDEMGFLWVTTRTGVNRFDGTHFDTYKIAHGLPHNLVRDLLKTESGQLWAASEAGLAYFDGTQFVHVLKEQWPVQVSGRVLQEAPDGTLWAATYGLGLLQLEVTGFDVRILQQFNQTTGFPSDRVRSLMVTEDGTVWAGDSAQVYRIQGGEYEVMDWQTQPSEIRSFYHHPDGSIWVGTRNGVAHFNGTAFVKKVFDVELEQYTINAISSDQSDRVWVSTRDYGAFQFDQNSRLNRHLHMGNGLPDNSINTVFQDTEKNLWLGTYGGGLARLSTTEVLNWKAQGNMPNPNVYSINNDGKGCIWVGTNGDGVSSFCGDEVTHITTADGLSHNKVLSGLIDQQGNPWFGTLQGVSYWQDGVIMHLDTSDGLSGSVVYHMALDQSGGIWLGTNNGLSHYQDGQFTTYRKTEGLPDNRINRVFLDNQDNLWLGTSNGLSRLANGHFTNWSAADGLAANFINDMYADDNGLLWLATNNGLSRFDGQAFTTWTTDQGLPHNNITTLLPGNNDDLWIGTSRGVAIYDNISFTVITTREGLVFDLVNRSAGYKDDEGNLWFGTGEGISRFSHDFKPGSTKSPPIHLISVYGSNGELPLNETGTFNEQESDLRFNYTAISFQRAPDVNFRYRLATHDETPWRHTRLNEIQFNSLAAGKYNFQVTARIGNGQWNPLPATYQFTVMPPFWRTPWFILLLVASLFLAWFFRGWRNRQHALKLEQLVQQRTKELNEVNQGLDWMANHDNLTKLCNRHFVQEYIQRLGQSNEITPLGVLNIDLDYFKAINDEFGHGMGDLALKVFSEMIKQSIPKDHLAARWGGEEFIVLCPQSSAEKTQQLATDVLHGTRRLKIKTESDQVISLRCSVGFVHLKHLSPKQDLGRQIEKAIQLADKALYEAKHQGRDQVCGYLIDGLATNTTLDDYISNTQHAKEQNWMHTVTA